MIQITETQVVEPFGEFFRMDPLRRDDGTYPVTIVVGTRGSGSLHPRQLMLVIQLTEDEQRMVKQTMEDSRLIPTYLRIDKAELTIVNNEAKVKS